MKISKEEQARFIREEIQAWMREDVEPTLRAAIAKRERHIPEGTEDELRQDIYQAAANMLPGYQLSFRDASRIVDMRPSSVSWVKRPITKDNNFMLQWAQGRGRKFMKRVPGYKDGKAPNLTEEQKLERFSSAIIAAYGRGKNKRRRRGAWYSRTINRLITKLTDRLARNQAEFFSQGTAEEIRKAMK